LLASESEAQSYVLSANIPIFQGGALWSRSRESRYNVERARQSLQERESTVIRDTRNLYRAVVTDVVRVQARIRAIKSAESALEATQTGYEVGTRNIVDVLQAQQRLFQSQFDYADSRYHYVLGLMYRRLGEAEKSKVAFAAFERLEREATELEEKRREMKRDGR
jgi:outer membrane protein